jgi:hypothetical protein
MSLELEQRMNHNREKLARRNGHLASLRYGVHLSKLTCITLKALTRQFGFSIELGDVLLLDGSWYVTHSGLLRLATRKGCVGIRVVPVTGFCAPEQSRWAFRATAFKTADCKGFNGYGDADPGNVSALVRGAEMRIAETRAVNRALRKAYGIGVCSIEEIGSFNSNPEPAAAVRKAPQPAEISEHPLRDRLLVLVRKHRLDAGLVKLYAAEFCGVDEIRQASREQMKRFIDHLAEQAANDADAVRQKLASYQKVEAGAA